MATGRPHLSTNQHHHGRINAAAWSPDGTIIATGDSRGEVRLWSAVDGTPVNRLQGPEWGVFALRFSGDGKRIVLCGDRPSGLKPATGPVQWFDVSGGKPIREVVPSGRARLLAASPDESLLAITTNLGPDAIRAGDKPALLILEADLGKQRGEVELSGSWHTAVGWSSDGKQVLAATTKHVVIVQSDPVQKIAEVELPHARRDPHTGLLVEGGFYRTAFRRGGAEVITVGELPEVCGWKLPSGERLWGIKIETETISAIGLSPDERMLACVTGARRNGAKSVLLLDIAARRELEKSDLSQEDVNQLAFSPDGRRLLVAFNDGTALVFDTSEAKNLLREPD